MIILNHEQELLNSNMKNEENETIIQEKMNMICDGEESELCKNKQIEELENNINIKTQKIKTFEKQLNDIKSEMDEFEELNNKNIIKKWKY